MMTGKQIIDLWNKAKEAFYSFYERGGIEIGGKIRGKGYKVLYDGASVCTFQEADGTITYKADCDMRRWQMQSIIYLGNDLDGDWIRIGDIEPSREYQIV